MSAPPQASSVRGAGEQLQSSTPGSLNRLLPGCCPLCAQRLATPRTSGSAASEALHVCVVFSTLQPGKGRRSGSFAHRPGAQLLPRMASDRTSQTSVVSLHNFTTPVRLSFTPSPPAPCRVCVHQQMLSKQRGLAEPDNVLATGAGLTSRWRGMEKGRKPSADPQDVCLS